MENKKPRAAMYIRVASAEQLESEAEKQARKLKEYAEAIGYEIVGKTVVHGSATENLSELQRLAIDRNYRNDAEVILATDPSRLTRDASSLLDIVRACSIANLRIALADGTGDITARVGFLPILQMKQPDYQDEESTETDEGFCQSM